MKQNTFEEHLLTFQPLVSLRCLMITIFHREKDMQIHLIYRITVKSCIRYFLYFFIIKNN